MRDGESHGVFINNIMGLDVLITNETATYRFIGGVIDIYVMPGTLMNTTKNSLSQNNLEMSLRNNAKEVVRTYHRMIGTPKLPPYWTLGYHQSRWGYNSADTLQTVANDFTANQVPLESIWFPLSPSYYYYYYYYYFIIPMK